MYVRTKEKKDRKVGRRDERTYVRNFKMGKWNNSPTYVRK